VNPSNQEPSLRDFESTLRLLANAFWQLDARFDALKTIFCELHPDKRAQLEELIQSGTQENLRKFEQMQQTIEFLRSRVPGKPS
jgi:hypothetical protein